MAFNLYALSPCKLLSFFNFILAPLQHAAKEASELPDVRIKVENKSVFITVFAQIEHLLFMRTP